MVHLYIPPSLDDTHHHYTMLSSCYSRKQESTKLILCIMKSLQIMAFRMFPGCGYLNFQAQLEYLVPNDQVCWIIRIPAQISEDILDI